ncbi:MAG: hypothetical protein IJP60_00555 [Bacilli bacterium]|nr:hypothetical protein [Bacilli bacterium]
MSLFHRKKQIEVKELPTLDNVVQKKLLLFITIVGEGQSTAIRKLFERYGCSAQFVERGEGTATKEIYNILGVENTGKDVVFSFLAEDKASDIKKELDAFFVASKRNQGISFSIRLSSIIGVRVYQFLANTVEDK